MTNDRLSLEALAQKYGADKKASSHNYTPIYESVLDYHWRENAKIVVEIGVWRGASVRMWHDYFQQATIYGFDRKLPFQPGQRSLGMPKLEGPRIHIIIGDQAKRSDLLRAVETIGQPIDVLIDDGGHTMEQQQTSLGYLFKYLSPGGLYVIEDLYVCYYKSKLGTDWNPTKTKWDTLRLLRALRDGHEIHSDFMTPWELKYLKTNAKDIAIDKGRTSEIGLITKRRAYAQH